MQLASRDPNTLQVARGECRGTRGRFLVLLQVLLAGATGLKSVQVRAGTGMKVVDGTLQRSPSHKIPSAGGT